MSKYRTSEQEPFHGNSNLIPTVATKGRCEVTMAANQFERNGKGRKVLKELFANPEKVSVIHYSCESFYDLPDGRSPRITSIAIRKLDNAQTESFSIHQIAEIRGTGLSGDEIEPHYNKYEKAMLDAYFGFLKINSERKFIHWNMRDQNYGFRAIEHRYRVLGGDPYIIQDDRKIDLSRLLIDLYGVNYVGHPRIENLAQKNKIEALDFMTGKQEADAFKNGRYVDLHRSTLRKVDVFCSFAQRAFDKSLKTNSSWKDAHGLSWKTAIYLAKKHWVFTIVIFVCGLVSWISNVFNSFKDLASMLRHTF